MVIKKNVQKMSSVHGTRVLTSKTKNDEMTEVNNSVFLLAKHFLTKMSIIQFLSEQQLELTNKTPRSCIRHLASYMSTVSKPLASY